MLKGHDFQLAKLESEMAVRKYFISVLSFILILNIALTGLTFL